MKELVEGADMYPHHFWARSEEGIATVCIESFVRTYLEHVEPRLLEAMDVLGITSPLPDSEWRGRILTTTEPTRE